MRIPFKVVIPCCMAVTGTTWWLGTRHLDFMKEPDAASLERVRMETLERYPDPDQMTDALAAPDPKRRGLSSDDDGPTPKITLEEISRPPELTEYSDRARYGTNYLIGQAKLLEQADHPQRALLAWERVLDSCKPNARQAEEAMAAIPALRSSLPAWNQEPTQVIPVTIHIGTGSHTAQRLLPLLDSLCTRLTSASAGILRITSEIATGIDDSQAPAPVAIWIAGAGENSKSTDILSFTASTDSDLTEEMARSLYELIRSQLARETQLNAPPALITGGSAVSNLESAITRRAWKELGESLQAKP